MFCLGGQLLHKLKVAATQEEAVTMIAKTLEDGSALLKFRDMCVAQGVDTGVADRLCASDADVFEVLPRSKQSFEIKSTKSGLTFIPSFVT